jgi:hypothetical protein
LGHSRTARTSILNNYNHEGPDPSHLNPDILKCTMRKLGIGESLTSGNWLVLFDPPNSIIMWKQVAARNVRLRMKETISLFQLQADALYESFMADRLASREVSHRMIRVALGDEIRGRGFRIPM